MIEVEGWGDDLFVGSVSVADLLVNQGCGIVCPDYKIVVAFLDVRRHLEIKCVLDTFSVCYEVPLSVI